ncbi:hypothetical protein [Streptomyces sp. NBC_01445]|uniref:hypothetical protein n=1 Tax=Streptomyces sp. NBC_01445 TaxID=2903869 RepID=UPI002DD8C325|nr:hypothetical protein [Streptomyces sp. NBC_01445]WSE11783.1 hypothetical protein OG574_52465 [Streptomyces sp. NBC_01445]
MSQVDAVFGPRPALGERLVLVLAGDDLGALRYTPSPIADLAQKSVDSSTPVGDGEAVGGELLDVPSHVNPSLSYGVLSDSLLVSSGGVRAG